MPFRFLFVYLNLLRFWTIISVILNTLYAFIAFSKKVHVSIMTIFEIYTVHYVSNAVNFALDAGIF